uniref:Uncharacterized protein n=1 Tax=Oryza meridionalis TaxID=40149 RepID=A0A0E0EJ02_9ORYZ
MFQRWGLKASPKWNISGEPCSGAAIDDKYDIEKNLDLFYLSIKCNCTYNNNKVCHITKL